MLNNIKDNPGARTSRKRVGRGIGSGKGKTAGSGTKGQRSRTGVAIKGFEGGQMPIHRRLPKRGFNNIFRQSYEVINTGVIQNLIDSKKLAIGTTITKENLQELGLISSTKKLVKVLAKGKLSASITIQVDAASKTALAAIEKAGGKLLNTAAL